MIYYIAYYSNEAYTGRKIEIDLIAGPKVTLFDLNKIYSEFEQTPNWGDIMSLESSGRCLIKADKDSKTLIFFVNPLHSNSKQLIRLINLNKII